MSTQVQLHVRTEGMTDEMLHSEGVTGGPFGQLMGPDYFEEFTDLLVEAPSQVVGNDVRDEHASKVRNTINGTETVDRSTIDKIEAVTNGADNQEQILEFLREHEGEEVFVVSH